jgi:hypothetical protein
MKANDFYTIALDLNLPNEKIENIKIDGRVVFFSAYGLHYSAKLTETGRYKKNSVRRDF